MGKSPMKPLSDVFECPESKYEAYLAPKKIPWALANKLLCWSMTVGVESAMKMEYGESVLYTKEKGGGLKRKGKVDDGDERFNWGNTKNHERVCYRGGCPQQIAQFCIADMPNDIKHHIIDHSANMAKWMMMTASLNLQQIINLISQLCLQLHSPILHSSNSLSIQLMLTPPPPLLVNPSLIPQMPY